MATLDWIVLITCSIGILYCLVTMPKPIISKEEWEKLPEGSEEHESNRELPRLVYRDKHTRDTLEWTHGRDEPYEQNDVHVPTG